MTAQCIWVCMCVGGGGGWVGGASYELVDEDNTFFIKSALQQLANLLMWNSEQVPLFLSFCTSLK